MNHISHSVLSLKWLQGKQSVNTDARRNDEVEELAYLAFLSLKEHKETLF